MHFPLKPISCILYLMFSKFLLSIVNVVFSTKLIDPAKMIHNIIIIISHSMAGLFDKAIHNFWQSIFVLSFFRLLYLALIQKSGHILNVQFCCWSISHWKMLTFLFYLETIKISCYTIPIHAINFYLILSLVAVWQTWRFHKENYILWSAHGIV